MLKLTIKGGIETAERALAERKIVPVRMLEVAGRQTKFTHVLAESFYRKEVEIWYQGIDHTQSYGEGTLLWWQRGEEN